jgi:hypothetical protein
MAMRFQDDGAQSNKGYVIRNPKMTDSVKIPSRVAKRLDHVVAVSGRRTQTISRLWKNSSNTRNGF